MPGREYLMIENEGLVDEKLLTVVGASTARGHSELIGQFGSGWKFSIALCLRSGVDLRVFRGKQGYEFGVEEDVARDVRDQEVLVNEVFMRGFTGPSKAKKRLGFDAYMGEMDWQEIGLALREFVSNAADASMTLRGDYGGCRLLYRSEEDIKGEEGKTRVYVELTDEVRAWDLKKYFMIFDKDYDPAERIIPKRVVNGGLRVYRKGVLVGEFPSRRSLWDYNLPDIPLKESRIITTEDARTQIGYALKEAGEEKLVEWFQAVRDARDVFEVMEVSPYALRLGFGEEDREERTETWAAAFREVFTDAGVICDSDFAADGVRRKGYNPVKVEPSLAGVLKSYGMKSSGSVLDHFEAAGREKHVLTPGQAERMKEVWDILVEMGLTKDRPQPPTEGFRTVMDAGSTTEAYYDPSRDVIGMSEDVLNDQGFKFEMAALEEDAHAIMKARDNTRDLQDWAFRGFAMLLHAEIRRRRKARS